MGQKIYVIQIFTGSWDSAWWKIGGIYSDKEMAEKESVRISDRQNALLAEFSKYGDMADLDKEIKAQVAFIKGNKDFIDEFSRTEVIEVALNCPLLIG